MTNTVYWDETPRLTHHQATLQALAERASLHYLKLGSEIEGLPAAINQLG